MLPTALGVPPLALAALAIDIPMYWKGRRKGAFSGDTPALVALSEVVPGIFSTTVVLGLRCSGQNHDLRLELPHIRI